jgi:O-antigen/teichoic acid export membrane protein
MEEENLKKKTVRALSWSFVDKFGQQIIYFATGIVLARSLSGADYGLVGMLAIFVALSSVLLDSGFGGYFMKKQNATQTDYNALFYFNVFISTGLYIILFFSAPLIASFYNEPQLVWLARILFLSILFNSFNLIQNLLLTKHLQIGHLARINFVALAMSSAVATALAISGYGVWALVAQTLLLSIFKTLLLWFTNSWRPSWGFSTQPLKEAFSFSSHLFMSGLINAVFNNIYSVVIGKFYNKMELGIYQQGNKYQDIPVSLISNTFRTIALPLFSNVNTDNERLIRVLTKTLQSMAFVLFPVVFLLCVIAEPFIIGLIGERWFASVPIFRILLISGLFSGFAQLFNELLISKGKSRTFLRVEIIKRFFLIAMIAFTFRLGIETLAWGWVAYSLVNLLFSGYFGCKILNYRFSSFFKSLLPYFSIAVMAAAGSWSLSLISINDYVRMGLQIFLFGIIYGSASWYFELEIGKEAKQSLVRLKKLYIKKTGLKK